MIKLKTMTCCLDVKESTKVLELKNIVGGILKKDVDDIKLLKDNQVNCAQSNTNTCRTPIHVNVNIILKCRFNKLSKLFILIR